MFSLELAFTTTLSKTFPLCCLPLGKSTLAVGCSDGSIRIYDTYLEKTVNTLYMRREVTRMVVLKDLEGGFISMDQSGIVYLWCVDFVEGANEGLNTPIGQLVDRSGKGLNHSISWMTYHSGTRSLAIGGHGKYLYTYHFDKEIISTIRKELDTRRGSTAGKTRHEHNILQLHASMSASNLPVHYKSGKYCRHPAFPLNAIICFRAKKSIVEIVYEGASIEAFDLKILSKNLWSKLKIYTISMHETKSYCIVCGTNVGIFVVSLMDTYRACNVPLLMDDHSKNTAFGTFDGIQAIFFSMNTERIVTIQSLRFSETKRIFTPASDKHIWIVPDELGEATSLLGGGPLIFLNFENKSCLLDIIELGVSPSPRRSQTLEKERASGASSDPDGQDSQQYSLQLAGHLPLIHGVAWTVSFEYCALAMGTHVHVFVLSPRLHRITTVVMQLGGPGASIHTSAQQPAERATSMLWWHKALFITTETRVLCSFPFDKSSGGHANIVTLATTSNRELPRKLMNENVTCTKLVSSEDSHFCWTTQSKSSVGSLANQSKWWGKYSGRSNPNVGGYQVGRCETSNDTLAQGGIQLNTDTFHPDPQCRPPGASVVLNQVRIIDDTAFGNNVKHRAAALLLFAPCDTSHKNLPNSLTLIHPVFLDHPVLRFKLLVASGEIREALRILCVINSRFQDGMGSFLDGHDFAREALEHFHAISYRTKLKCMLRNGMLSELENMIEVVLLEDSWMIQSIATGLAQDRNTEALIALLRFCIEQNRFHAAAFVSHFLPRYLQMKTRGIIAKHVRKQTESIGNNMTSAQCMAFVTTIGKLRPSRATVEDGGCWKKMPSNESLLRVWNGELAKNCHHSGCRFKLESKF
eukprot:Stramenopile-MAST_4_protein_977